MTDLAVQFNKVSKYCKLYSSPRERLKEALHPLGKKFHKEFYALKNISFELKQGKILGGVGKNGRGKSTLLKLLTHIIRPTRGTIEINGRISALLELGTGFHPDLTGRENIYLNSAASLHSQPDRDGLHQEPSSCRSRL